MNVITRSILLALLLTASTTPSLGDPAVEAKPEPTTNRSSEAASDPEATARASCISHCDAAESRCSSEVRRARQQCSKRAANAGRDPFTMRNNDYSYFCGYFGNPNHCGANSYSGSCRTRFSRTYGLCIDAMQENIASMRYDCYQTERTAQNYCRDELRECKASCE